MLDDPWLEVFSSLAHVPPTSCGIGVALFDTSGFKELGDTCISLHGCSRVSSGRDDMMHDIVLLYKEGRISQMLDHKT